jgi:hypothetical protein
VGAHLAPFWNGFERRGEGARPIDFESDLIAAGHLVSDFVLLARHHFLSRSAAAKIQVVIATAVRKEFAGKDF